MPVPDQWLCGGYRPEFIEDRIAKGGVSGTQPVCHPGIVIRGANRRATWSESGNALARDDVDDLVDAVVDMTFRELGRKRRGACDALSRRNRSVTGDSSRMAAVYKKREIHQPVRQGPKGPPRCPDLSNWTN